MKRMRSWGWVLGLSCAFSGTASDLPGGFSEEIVIGGLDDPASMAFAPDGRLFIAERVEGRLRIAYFDASGGTWNLNADPFYTFDIPKNNAGDPEPHRSSGLRGFAFDPDFENNGYVYCFYMKDTPRHGLAGKRGLKAHAPKACFGHAAGR